MSELIKDGRGGSMKLSNNKMRLVANLGQHLQFVSDSQDMQAIRAHLGEDAGNYDAFFVDTRDGEYIEVWGMVGIIPYNSKLVSRLIPQGNA
jgi:hypothetical protein